MTGRLRECLVTANGTLLEAMRSLDRSNAQIVLVVDGATRLAGTLTDGDIRRALLKGAALDSALKPHINTRFVSVSPDAGRAHVLELMQARSVSQIPVIDQGGGVVGLHLLHELITSVERPNWVVIMAGGRGTRLLPLTETVPKPMLLVAGRPILERIVLHLVGQGLKRIFLAVSYLSDIIEAHFGDGQRFGCHIEYLREPQPLGTGGALALLPAPPVDPLLVMNGDLITEADVGAMVEFHVKGRHAATMGVRKYFHTVPFGCVEVDGKRILGLAEKPTLSRLVNTGIYVLDPELVARVPRDQASTLPELIQGALARGEPAMAYEVDEDWIDVGRRDQLSQARGENS